MSYWYVVLWTPVATITRFIKIKNEEHPLSKQVLGGIQKEVARHISLSGNIISPEMVVLTYFTSVTEEVYNSWR